MTAVRCLWAVQILLIVLLQFRLWSGEGSFAQMSLLQDEIDKQKQENLQLKQRNERLFAEVRSLKSGVDEMEARARLDLGMIRRGETFFTVVDRHGG